jgi:hypothetical protein
LAVFYALIKYQFTATFRQPAILLIISYHNLYYNLLSLGQGKILRIVLFLNFFVLFIIGIIHTLLQIKAVMDSFQEALCLDIRTGLV